MVFRKSIFFVWLLFLLLSVRGSGQNYNVRCQQYCLTSYNWCSNWEVYVDWIYWNTRRCDLDFAFKGSTGASSMAFPTGKVYGVEPHYQSGFRIGGKKWCDRLFFDAFYTYYHTGTSNSAKSDLSATRVPNSVIISQGTVQLAQGKWKIDYDTVDLLAGYTFSKKSCFHPYVLGGLKLAWIDQRLNTFYQTGTNIEKVHENLDMNAYGVDFGIGMNTVFCRCFNVFGRLSCDVLLGDFKRDYRYKVSTDSGDTFSSRADLHDKCWRTLSVLNILFGVGYNTPFLDCWCSHLGLSIGYEFHQWIGVPDFLTYQGVGQLESFNRHLQGLGFDGLFLRVFLGF